MINPTVYLDNKKIKMSAGVFVFVLWLFQIVIFLTYFDVCRCKDVCVCSMFYEDDFCVVVLFGVDAGIFVEVYEHETAVSCHDLYVCIVADVDISVSMSVVANCYVGSSEYEAFLWVDDAVSVVDEDIVPASEVGAEMPDDEIV